MIRILVGSFFGFIAGMTYGLYQVVEVENSLAVKVVKIIKVIWGAL